MKAAAHKPKRRTKVRIIDWPVGKPRPRMTRDIAEARAVGDPTKPKFDGVAFLRGLKK